MYLTFDENGFWLIHGRETGIVIPCVLFGDLRLLIPRWGFRPCWGEARDF
jgi:hypothetical protein